MEKGACSSEISPSRACLPEESVAVLPHIHTSVAFVRTSGSYTMLSVLISRLIDVETELFLFQVYLSVREHASAT